MDPDQSEYSEMGTPIPDPHSTVGRTGKRAAILSAEQIKGFQLEFQIICIRIKLSSCNFAIEYYYPYPSSTIFPREAVQYNSNFCVGYRAFSDFQVRILMQITEGDLVATRWQFSATQTGPNLGHLPTGKRATRTGVQIDRVKNGKIVESWVDWDKFRLFTDLGFLK